MGAYWPTFVSIADRWASESTYGHGWLIAIVSAVLLLRALPGLMSGRPQLPVPMLVGLAASAALWLLGFAADISTAQQLAIPFVLWFAAGCLFGWRALAVLWVPFAALLLVMPVWGALLTVLQPLSVFLTESLTSLLGIPVHVHGNTVMIPAGTFEVEEACSGLRFFLAATVLAILVGEVCGMLKRHRVVLLIGAMIAAVGLNCVRIVTVVVLGQMTSMQHPLVADHGIIGECYFAAFVLVPMVILARRVGFAPPAEPEERSALSWARGALVKPMLGVAAVALAVPLIARGWDAARVDGATVAVEFQEAVSGWRAAQGALPWRPSYPGAALEATAGFISPTGSEVQLYVASYLDESQGKELIGFNSRLAPTLRGSHVRSAEALGIDSVVESQTVDVRGQAWVLWHWYQIGERRTSNASRVKLVQLAGWFARAKPATVTLLATRCLPDCGAGARTLDDFLESYPTLAESVSRVEQSGD